jgi:Fe-S oxidoreductase
MSPVSLTYGGIPGYAIFWGLFIVAGALFLHRTYKLWRYLLLGNGWGSFGPLLKRLPTTLLHGVAQWCQFKTVSPRDLSGLAHVLVAWGFFIFVIYYFLFIFIGAGFGVSDAMKSNRFFFYYSWVMDIAAPLVVLAALWGIVRRYLVRPPRLKGEQTVEALIILVTLCIHPITHLFKEATSIHLGHPPVGLGSSLPIISATLSQLYNKSTLNSVQSAGIGFFWAHWCIVLFVLVYIAYSRYLHIIAAPFNILLSPSRPQGTLEPIDFESTEAFGVSSIKEFTRRELLECYACVLCGRCQDACPAYATGKPLSPKKVIQDIKEHLLRAGPKLLANMSDGPAANPERTLAGGVITKDEIWACTTCSACVESCPVGNDQIGMIVDLRRRLVYDGIFDGGHKKALQRVALDFNPWGMRWNTRAKNIGVEQATQDETYDCIYWIGCVASFDDRVREFARATANLLRAAGLRFAILGVREKCCGDFVRRLGDEGLFQQLAQENIETLGALKFDSILTHCPHCFNTIKNEYPQFGGNFKVVHHTQLILDLLRKGKIRLQESHRNDGEKVIYHDPCYLGRMNGLYQEPRLLLGKVFGEIMEFPRNHEKSFCCGAGGGNIWKELEGGSKTSVQRLEEAMRASPQIIATACPFCFLMFQEAIQIKGSGEEMSLMDIAEIVEKFHR